MVYLRKKIKVELNLHSHITNNVIISTFIALKIVNYRLEVSNINSNTYIKINKFIIYNNLILNRYIKLFYIINTYSFHILLEIILFKI